jgi:hypothetical protein
MGTEDNYTRIAYIMGDARSGSTLLDQLLVAHPRVISLGEVKDLPAYARQDRSLYNHVHPLICSCGAKFDRCEFWAAVRRRLGRPLTSVGPDAFPSVVPKHPWLFRWMPRPREIMDVFDAVESDYVVDSSKCAFCFRTLYDLAPNRVKGIVPVRDYRATVHSKTKRGQGLEKSARSWAKRMQQIETLTKGLSVLTVHYEDLCLDQRSEMVRLCDYLGIEFCAWMLVRLEVSHRIGRSPSKFDPSKKEGKIDLAHSDAFSTKQLETMRSIAGRTAASGVIVATSLHS